MYKYWNGQNRILNISVQWFCTYLPTWEVYQKYVHCSVFTKYSFPFLYFYIVWRLLNVVLQTYLLWALFLYEGPPPTWQTFRLLILFLVILEVKRVLHEHSIFSRVSQSMLKWYWIITAWIADVFLTVITTGHFIWRHIKRDSEWWIHLLLNYFRICQPCADIKA